MPDRRRVRSGSPFEDRYGFCRALRDGDRVLVAGTAPVFPDGSCPPDVTAQARRCFDIYVAGVLGVVPFLLRVKADTAEPLIFIAILALLFAVRLADYLNRRAQQRAMPTRAA